VPNRIRILDDAARRLDRLLLELGEQLREARLAAGLTLAQVARKVGSSAAEISRIEHGRVRSLRLDRLAAHAAAVGLRMSGPGLFPLGAAIRDAAQIRYLKPFLARVAASWARSLEAPVGPGDLRAVDVLLVGAGCRIAVEVITRLRDIQAQVRAAIVKQQAIGADWLVLVIADTNANRRALREAMPVLAATFPLDSRRTMAALAAGRDPGANGIVLLRASDRS
jgi:transcriptional regulator with XRE-family HTH domain